MQQVFGLDIPRTLDEACDPRRLALIVYDMQVGILRQIANGDAIITNVARVLHAARESGVRVCFTRHLSLPKELMGVFQWRIAMAWQRVERVEDVKPWFLRDTPGFELVPEMRPQPSEAIFDKITMSAFEGTPLNIVLRDCGVRVFAIVGVATEIGIEPSVRHGADLGYIPIVVRDACGAGHAEAAARAHIGDARHHEPHRQRRTDYARFRSPDHSDPPRATSSRSAERSMSPSQTPPVRTHRSRRPITRVHNTPSMTMPRPARSRRATREVRTEESYVASTAYILTSL